MIVARQEARVREIFLHMKPRILAQWTVMAITAMASTTIATQGADTPAAAQANNAFALDLYGKLREGSGNVFFSPYSISTALAMTYAGAKGETAAQMEKALHFPANQKIHGSLAQLQEQLNAAGKNKGMELNIANGLWAQQGHPFLPAFLSVARDRYQARVEQANFRTGAERARQEINRWVEDQTRNRIRDLLPAGSVDKMTRMVLANAIYFKGIWAKQFKTSATAKAPFYLAGNRQKTTPLMRHFDEVKYAENEELQAIELPYAGGDLAMLVLLPRERDGLAKVEQGLSAEKISALVSEMRTQRAEIFLPRFKVDAGVSLKPALMALGMRTPFDDNSDFSGMDGTRDLYISQVFHKAWCQVNEEGTEAAAATGVVVATRAAPIAQPPVFRADHPFVFVIRDTKSGAFLFMGRLADPQE